MPTTPQRPVSRVRRADLAARLFAAHAPMREAFGKPLSETQPIAHAVYVECERIEREYGGNRDDCIAYWQRQQITTLPFQDPEPARS